MARKSDELTTLDHAIWSVEVYLDEFAEDERDLRQTQAELAELYTMRKRVILQENSEKRERP